MLSTRELTRWTCVLSTILVLASGMPALGDKPAGKPGGGDRGPSYEIVPLDDAGGVFTDTTALDINDQGQIVGYVLDPLDEGHAACWTTSEVNGEVQWELNLLPSLVGETEEARSINESGQIVGRGGLDGQGVALYWPDRETEPIVLPPFAEDEEYGAFGINENGVICGRSERAIPRLDESGNPVLDEHGNAIIDWVTRALVWRISETGIFGPMELPTPEFASAAAVNDNDADGLAEIVGAFRDAAYGETAAVVWTVQSNGDGTLTADPPQPEVLDVLARANGVNNLGEICGDDWTETTTSEAVVWAGDSSLVLDRARNVLTAWASDINDNGVIVGAGDYWKKFTQGHRAVVWPSATGSMIVLADFLDRDSPFATLTNASAINGAGEIVGSGLDAPYDGSSYGAFLAIPE